MKYITHSGLGDVCYEQCRRGMIEAAAEAWLAAIRRDAPYPLCAICDHEMYKVGVACVATPIGFWVHTIPVSPSMGIRSVWILTDLPPTALLLVELDWEHREAMLRWFAAWWRDAGPRPLGMYIDVMIHDPVAFAMLVDGGPLADWVEDQGDDSITIRAAKTKTEQLIALWEMSCK